MNPNNPLPGFSQLYFRSPFIPGPPVQNTYIDNAQGSLTMNIGNTQHYDVNMQNQLIALKAEVTEKNQVIARLEERVRTLERELTEKSSIIERDWGISTHYEDLKDVTRKYDVFSDYYRNIFKGLSINSECYTTELPVDTPELLAKIDGLYKSKDVIDLEGSVKILMPELNAITVNKVINYIETVKYEYFLTTIYSRILGSNSNPRYNQIMTLLVSNHLTRESPTIATRDVVDVMRQKYNNNLDSSITSIFLDIVDIVEGDDYIYHRHKLNGISLSMLHAFSHFSYSITGSDIAQYHVGKACRISECSLIEIMDDYGQLKYYKPIKCSGEYVILPKLPSESNYRVEGVMHRNGITPITLVRVIDERRTGTFVSGSISQEVCGLMNKAKLCKFDFYFSDKGLCIEASGELNTLIPSTISDPKCCDRAFRYNGHRQRTHKYLKRNLT